jgi:hypothetical protein
MRESRGLLILLSLEPKLERAYRRRHVFVCVLLACFLYVYTYDRDIIQPHADAPAHTGE